MMTDSRLLSIERPHFELPELHRDGLSSAASSSSASPAFPSPAASASTSSSSSPSSTPPSLISSQDGAQWDSFFKRWSPPTFSSFPYTASSSSSALHPAQLRDEIIIPSPLSPSSLSDASLSQSLSFSNPPPSTASSTGSVSSLSPSQTSQSQSSASLSSSSATRSHQPAIVPPITSAHSYPQSLPLTASSASFLYSRDLLRDADDLDVADDAVTDWATRSLDDDYDTDRRDFVLQASLPSLSHPQHLSSAALSSQSDVLPLHSPRQYRSMVAASSASSSAFHSSNGAMRAAMDAGYGTYGMQPVGGGSGYPPHSTTHSSRSASPLSDVLSTQLDGLSLNGSSYFSGSDRSLDRSVGVGGVYRDRDVPLVLPQPAQSQQQQGGAYGADSQLSLLQQLHSVNSALSQITQYQQTGSSSGLPSPSLLHLNGPHSSSGGLLGSQHVGLPPHSGSVLPGGGLPHPPLPNSNLYVDQLPIPFSEHDLRSIFVPFGPIEKLRVATDPATGEQMGYGFVMFQYPEDAQRAIAALHNCQLGHKTLHVSLAKQKNGNKQQRASHPSTPISSFSPSSSLLQQHAALSSLGSGSAPSLSPSLLPHTPNTNVYMAGIPHHYSKAELDELTAPYGHILESRVLIDKQTQTNRGIGFVRYERVDEAAAAILALNGCVAPGGTEVMVVKLAVEKGGEGGRRDSLRGNDLRGMTALQALKAQRMQSAGAAGGADGLYGHRSILSTDDPIVSPRHPTLARQNSSHLPSSSVRPPSPPAFLRAASDDSSPYSSFNSHPSASSGSAGLGGKGVDLFVFHLPVSVSEDELQQLFALYGPVLNVAVMRDRRTGEHKGFGFVTMQNVADAENAVKYLTGYALGSKYLKVSFKTNKSHQQQQQQHAQHHAHYANHL